MSDFVLLSKQFSLKGSQEEQILLALVGGEKYVLTADQYEFLSLCDGTLQISQILAQYDDISQDVITDFIKDLRKIGAIDISNQPANRTLKPKLAPSPRLQTIQLEATSACNLTCLHCYQGKQYPVANNLTQEECCKLIKQLAKMQVEGVSISGGEPLLDDKTYQLARLVEAHDMRVLALFTNGLLLEHHVVAEISEWQSQPTVFVSLDAITPDAFKFRGIKPAEAPEALKQTITGIEMLVAAKLPVVINTVVNQSNIATLHSMHKCVQSLGVASWRLGFPKRVGFFQEAYRQSEVPWNELLPAMFALLRHHLKCGNPFHLQIEYLYRNELFEDFTVLPDNAHICDYEGRRHSCCVKPNGDVVSCAYCTNMPVGNIRQQPLDDIWYSAAMQSTKDLRIIDISECSECELRGYCATGCRANASFLGGDFRASKDEYACRAVHYFVDQVLPYLQAQGIAK